MLFKTFALILDPYMPHLQVSINQSLNQNYLFYTSWLRAATMPMWLVAVCTK